MFTWILFGKNRIRINWAIHQMEKRYGEEFTFKRSVTYLEAPDGLEFYVEADDYPNRLIRVQVKWIKGKQVVTDSFLGVKFEQETEELLKKTLEETLNAEVYVAYSGDPRAMPEGASSDMTLEEYVQLPSSSIGFYAIIERQCSEDDKEELEMMIEESFIEHGICCIRGRIFFDNGEGHFDEIDNGITDSLYMMKEYYDCYLLFKMENATGFSKTEWIESKEEINNSEK